ncbi:c-type cytochrome [Halpernia sp.]|uniref:c-type cytochrome n=1 Tax=Halpernia sp. TaxID=2782209 RepID=UPI003A8E881A
MKNVLVASLLVLSLMSCNKSVKDSKIESNVMLPEPTQQTSEAKGTDEGLALIEGADCLTCHKMDTKLVGPSYKEVAAKYEPTDANMDMLADKIIAGGKGNWGEIPMSPHVGMSKETAKKMVKYILTLK